MSADRIGLFAGSFDPIHNGHVDLIERSQRLFDELHIAVFRNESKSALFTLEERLSLLEEVTKPWPHLHVAAHHGLLVDYAARVGASTVVRGLRSGTDLDYEFPMAHLNREMSRELDTIFLLPDPRFAHLSSSLIKEIHKLDGDIESFVPQAVLARLRA